MTPSDKQRRFMIEVEAAPYDTLFCDHSAQTKGECKYNDWVVQRRDGTWCVTETGMLAMGVDL